MRLTKGTDYGARGAVYLARQPEGAIVLVGEIAEAEGIPKSYLAKIFQTMVHHGIVRSHRGAKGGFSLARPAEEISFREVVEAIEGTVALAPCLNGGCERADTCAVFPLLASAQDRLLSTLDSASLHDLAAGEAAGLA